MKRVLRPLLEGFFPSSSFLVCLFLVKGDVDSEWTSSPHPWDIGGNRDKMKRGLCNAIKSQWSDFPGGPVAKNLPSNAGDAGSIPGQGTKIPHATGQISLRAPTKTRCNQK